MRESALRATGFTVLKHKAVAHEHSARYGRLLMFTARGEAALWDGLPWVAGEGWGRSRRPGSHAATTGPAAGRPRGARDQVSGNTRSTARLRGVAAVRSTAARSVTHGSHGGAAGMVQRLISSTAPMTGGVAMSRCHCSAASASSRAFRASSSAFSICHRLRPWLRLPCVAHGCFFPVLTHCSPGAAPQTGHS
jgi:hypothetical protein